jgi:hypothetical protein
MVTLRRFLSIFVPPNSCGAICRDVQKEILTMSNADALRASARFRH